MKHVLHYPTERIKFHIWSWLYLYVTVFDQGFGNELIGYNWRWENILGIDTTVEWIGD